MTAGDRVVGQVLTGSDSAVIIRQHPDGKLRLGDLLACDSDSGTMLMQVYSTGTGSQLGERVKEMVSGTMLLGPPATNFYEPEMPNYKLAEARPVFVTSGDEFGEPRGTVDAFTPVRRATLEDLSFMDGPGPGRLYLGQVRSGPTVIPGDGLWMDAVKAVTHHILIVASTGRGKSNLVKCMLWGLLGTGGVGMLVLDAHGEYSGLASHPRAHERLTRYTSSKNPKPGAISLNVNIRSVRPADLRGVVEMTDAQDQVMDAMYNRHGGLWIERLEEAVKRDEEEEDKKKGTALTRYVLLRKVKYALGLTRRNCVFSTESGIGSGTIKSISDKLDAGHVVVVDTTDLGVKEEQTVGNMLAGFVMYGRRSAKSDGRLDGLPPVGVIVEEAPRVLADTDNAYSEIAREGRKFKVGVVAVTQLASVIPDSVLANLSTKIIFGNQMLKERKAVIESAAQDISADSRSIASLHPGEAIATSVFTPFAVPIKVPLFDDLVRAGSRPAQKIKVVG